MNWPTSQDFNEAIQNAGCLSDPDLKSGQVITNAMGLPVPRSGNFADVYQFKGGDGTMWAVKLFTRKVPGLQMRYARIDAHLDKAQFPFTVGFQFHQEGIRIKGQYFPLLKMEWVEGFTLNDFVSENVTKPHYLHALVQMWAKLCGRLRDANFAHADLQHGNVLLVPGATPQKLGLKLIDYDGMWVPALAESHSGEVGHPNFQHPLRLKERLYNADVDRFPHLVIAAALRGTLVGGKALWDKFDNADNLLFKEQDLREPGNAPVFKALWNLNDPVLRTLVGHIVLSAKQPLRKTPWLDDVLLEEGGPRLSGEQQKQVAELLGVRATVSATHAAVTPLAVQEEFNVFRFLEDDAAAAPVLAKPAARTVPARTTKKSKSHEGARKSKVPLLIGGGVLALALLGGIIALAVGGKKEPTHPEIAKGDSEEQPKSKGSIIPKDQQDNLQPKDPPGGKITPVPPPAPWEAIPPRTVIRVAAIPKTEEYLFVRQDDPMLYRGHGANGRITLKVGRHLEPIRSLAVAADGARALTGAEDGTICAWSLKVPGAKAELKVHTKPVVALAISPDGTRAVSVGQDRLLCEWDLAEGKLLRKTTIPYARAIAYLPDGKSILLGTEKGPIGLWDLEKQAQVKELTGHDGPVNALCVAAKGGQAFSAGADGTIRSWNVAGATLLRTFAFPHQGGAYQVALAPDESILVSGGKDHTLRFYEAASGKVIGGLGWSNSTYTVDFFDEWQDIVVGVSGNGPPQLMQLTRNEQGTVHTAPPRLGTTPVVPKNDDRGPIVKQGEAIVPGPPANQIGYSPDGKILYVIRNGSLAIHEGDTGKGIKQIAVGGIIHHALFGPDKLLYIAVGDKLQAWDWDKDKCVHDLDWPKNRASITGILPTSDPKRLLLVTSSSTLVFWDAEKWEELGSVTPSIPEICTHAALHPDGVHFVLAFFGPGRDWRLAIWDLARKKQVVALEPADLKNLPYVEVSPNGKWVVVNAGLVQRYLHIWDATTGKLRHSIPLERNVRLSGGFTRGGDYYIFSERAGRRYAVDVAQGKLSDELNKGGVTARVSTTAPAAGLFASVDSDSKLRIWRVDVDNKSPVVTAISAPKGTVTEVAKNKEGLLGTSEPLSDAITGCAFSTDGKKIYVSTNEGVVHVLDTATLKEATKFEIVKGHIYHMVLLPKLAQLSGVSIPERLYLLDDNKHVRVWDTEKGALIKDINLSKSLMDVKSGYRIAVTPNDGNLMVFSEYGQGELAWDVRKGAQAIIAPLQRAPFANGTRRVAFSLDGRVGAAYAARKTIIWNVRTSKDIANLDSGAWSQYLGLLPDVNAVVGTDGSRLQAWDYIKGRELLDVTEPHALVGFGRGPIGFWATVTNKGAGVVTVGSDRAFRIWNVQTGKEGTSWKLASSPMGVVASSDGRLVAVSHTQPDVVSLWSLPNLSVKKP